MISKTATTAATISPMVLPEVPELLLVAVVVVVGPEVVVVGMVVEVAVVEPVVVVVARLVVVGGTVVATVEVGVTVEVGALVDDCVGVVTASGGLIPAADANRLGRATHSNTTRMTPTLARIVGEATLQALVVEEA